MMKIYTRRWTGDRRTWRRHLMALASIELDFDGSRIAGVFPTFVNATAVIYHPISRVNFLLRFDERFSCAPHPCVRLRADFFLLGIVLRSKNILRKGIVSLGTVTSSRSANGGECKKKLMWYNAIRNGNDFSLPPPNVPRIWRSVQVHSVDGNLLSTNPQVVSLLVDFMNWKFY